MWRTTSRQSGQAAHEGHVLRGVDEQLQPFAPLGVVIEDGYAQCSMVAKLFALSRPASLVPMNFCRLIRARSAAPPWCPSRFAGDGERARDLRRAVAHVAQAVAAAHCCSARCWVEAFAIIGYAQHDGRLSRTSVHAQVRTTGILHGVVHRFLEDEVEVLALAISRRQLFSSSSACRCNLQPRASVTFTAKAMHAFDHAGHVVVVGVHGPHDVVHGLQHLRGAVGDAAQQFVGFGCFAPAFFCATLLKSDTLLSVEPISSCRSRAMRSRTRTTFTAWARR
jgi:hypothetical protein